jgi:hypothetical protein
MTSSEGSSFAQKGGRGGRGSRPSYYNFW